MNKFLVVSTNSAEKFEKEVNQYLEMGYKFHGEPSIRPVVHQTQEGYNNSNNNYNHKAIECTTKVQYSQCMILS